MFSQKCHQTCFPYNFPICFPICFPKQKRHIIWGNRKVGQIPSMFFPYHICSHICSHKIPNVPNVQNPHRASPRSMVKSAEASESLRSCDSSNSRCTRKLRRSLSAAGPNVRKTWEKTWEKRPGKPESMSVGHLRGLLT